MKHIKLFENFSREYLKTNNNSLAAFYADKLGDFWLEKELLEKLKNSENFQPKLDGSEKGFFQRVKDMFQ
jgi:hypothetical protein